MYSDIGLSYVYALPIYIALSDVFVYCDHGTLIVRPGLRRRRTSALQPTTRMRASS